MKRHPSLIPLSHDHHDALVVAHGLIQSQGRSRAPRSDWPVDRRSQVDRLISFFEHTLGPHFDIEETDLFPTAMQRLPERANLIRDLLDEHAQMKSLIRRLQEDPASDLDHRLPALGTLLESHIRKEERVLFQAMQQRMSQADLERLGTLLASHRARSVACQVTSAERR